MIEEILKWDNLKRLIYNYSLSFDNMYRSTTIQVRSHNTLKIHTSTSSLYWEDDAMAIKAYLNIIHSFQAHTLSHSAQAAINAIRHNVIICTFDWLKGIAVL